MSLIGRIREISRYHLLNYVNLFPCHSCLQSESEAWRNLCFPWQTLVLLLVQRTMMCFLELAFDPPCSPGEFVIHPSRLRQRLYLPQNPLLVTLTQTPPNKYLFFLCCVSLSPSLHGDIWELSCSFLLHLCFPHKIRTLNKVS